MQKHEFWKQKIIKVSKFEREFILSANQVPQEIETLEFRSKTTPVAYINLLMRRIPERFI